MDATTSAPPDVTLLDDQLHAHLDKLTDFWRTRAVDPIHGGYQTSFDRDGKPLPETEKYLLSHTRLIWSFAILGEHYGDTALLDLAKLGVDYLCDKFRDPKHGGWFWKLSSAGEVVDDAKLVYGHSFVIYALAAFSRIAADTTAAGHANETFNLLQIHAADNVHGGYYENFTRSWDLAGPGPGGGDRKTLDIHMHLLEAFTELAKVTGLEVHHRKLADIRQVLLERMIDPTSGAGGNQYDAQFRPVTPITIDKTWIAERGTDPVLASSPTTTTSYGHNLELSWLLRRSEEILRGDQDVDVIMRLADHALRYGFDRRNGGVFREGPFGGTATDQDKEFWQNAEALVGFLGAYQITGGSQYLSAFTKTWAFARNYLISPAGEWHIRAAANGIILDESLGNHWTGGYHTIRATVESLSRMKAIKLQLHPNPIAISNDPMAVPDAKDATPG